MQNPEYVETVEEPLRSEILNPEITKKKGYTHINPVTITLGNAIKRIDLFRRAKGLLPPRKRGPIKPKKT